MLSPIIWQCLHMYNPDSRTKPGILHQAFLYIWRVSILLRKFGCPSAGFGQMCLKSSNHTYRQPRKQQMSKSIIFLKGVIAENSKFPIICCFFTLLLLLKWGNTRYCKAQMWVWEIPPQKEEKDETKCLMTSLQKTSLETQLEGTVCQREGQPRSVQPHMQLFYVQGEVCVFRDSNIQLQNRNLKWLSPETGLQLSSAVSKLAEHGGISAGVD